ncbi:hypothetical protein [Nitrospira sp. Nam74]
MRPAELARHAMVAVAFMVMGACAPAKVTTTASPGLGQYEVRSVAIMPFERLATPQILDPAGAHVSVPGGVKRSDIQIALPPAGRQIDREATTVPAFVPEKISRMVYQELKKRPGLRVIAPEEAVAAMPASGSGVSGISLEQRAKDVMKRTGADAALLGRVLVYRERDGSRWGAIPAVLGFEVKLMAPDGVTLWTANYYEKQRPLTEDLIGFWQHGGGFVTAEELAEYGAERVVREFPFGTV